MASSLSNLVNNLAEGIHEMKFKYRHDNEKCKNCRLNANIASTLKVLYTDVKDNLILHKCLFCNKNNQKTFYENLKKPFLIYINFLTMIPISLFYCCK